MKLSPYYAAVGIVVGFLSGCVNQDSSVNEAKWYSYQDIIKLRDQSSEQQNIQRLRLTDVDTEIDLSKLSSLRELCVSNADWSKIRNIPNGLTVLDVENVSHFKLTNDFRNLQKLAIHDCANFDLHIPSSLKNLFLDVCHNITIPTFPDTLRELRIVDTSFAQMTYLNLEASLQLKKLILHGGNKLLISGNLPKNLVEISILNNAMQYRTFDISEAEHLQKVAITNVVDIKLGNNGNLKEIQIFDSKNVRISGTFPKSLECIEVRDTSFRKGEVLHVSKDTEVSLDGCENLTISRN